MYNFSKKYITYGRFIAWHRKEETEWVKENKREKTNAIIPENIPKPWGIDFYNTLVVIAEILFT